MNKQTLVFLHGFPFNSSSWNSQVAFFNEKYNVLAPDLRGHRNGPEEAGPWMIADYANDLKTYLEKHNVKKAIICGLSMGGYIALHFAQQFPECVSGLILCDTQADADSNEAKDKRHATIQTIKTKGLNQFAEEFSKNVISEKTLKSRPEVKDELAAMIAANKPENIVMALGALASRRDSNAYLAQFNFPTLVLVGADDKITTPEHAKKLANGIAGAKLQLIEEAGHLSNYEQPAAFNSYVQIFLNGMTT